MKLPFSSDDFFGVFSAYNLAIWPTQIFGYLLGLVAIMALFQKWRHASRLILWILAVMWAVNGIVYHYLFFSLINPAASLFAVFFTFQAFLQVVAASGSNKIRFSIGYNVRSFLGSATIVYATLVYPILGIRAGHGLVNGPVFGVAPCPTTIFTIGMLMLARGKWVARLAIIPLLWSIVGLAAAIQLGMAEDFALPLASVTLLSIFFWGSIRAWHCRQAAASSLGSTIP